MKPIICKCMFLLLMFVAPSLCSAELPDGLMIDDGRITGTVTAIFAKGSEQETAQTLLVDCAIPEAAYTEDIFEVEFRHFTKEDMQQALRACEQSDQGTFHISQSEARYENTTSIDPCAELSREDAAAQATRIGIAYFEALGIEVVPVVVERPYDLAAFMDQEAQRYGHMYSDPLPFLARARDQWVRTHRYETRAAAYTRVTFAVIIGGMQCFTQPSYPAGSPDEPEARIGFEVSASVLVSDSGILVEAAASHIPEIKAQRSVSANEDAPCGGHPLIRAESWQDALNAALCDASHTGSLIAGAEEHLYQSQDMQKPVTAYASESVITEIYPCLSAISQDEWAMFWYVGAELQFAGGYKY